MKNLISTINISKINVISARLSIAASSVAIISLLMLHVTSPELDPSWHMISEYAYGAFGWLLTLFFLSWGLSSWSAATALFPLMKNGTSKVGIVLLVISGLGEIMGALFDIRHNLHGAAFGLGVPTLPIAALMLSIYFVRTYKIDRTRLLITAHSTWISLVLMAVTMGIFISGLRSTGAFHPEAKTMLTSLPEGVIALIGYANRLLVITYLIWLIVGSNAAIKAYRDTVRSQSTN